MRERLRVVVRGAVQGVGFRPFVYRLASDLRLDGWVLNSPQGVFIEVEGAPSNLELFLTRLERDRPRLAVIQSVEPSWLDPVPYHGFEIRSSRSGGATTALVLPDIAMCGECRVDIADPANPRYRYPFTNCTNCGPRFSIIERLPYDRVNTTMRAFEMCPACHREYHDPGDRRFHAQPNACPVCGPQLALWNDAGETLADRDQALLNAAEAIREGRIVAVKGLGGFHLMVDAGNDAAVRRLRARKHREEKPLALMFPDIDDIRRYCDVSPLEARLLSSPESPIVILARRARTAEPLSPAIAPRNPSLGVMLPYTPLHELLLKAVGRPVVATSGNVSDEPICTDERNALARLGGIADLFLMHNRPIARHVDDSIVRIVLDRELVLRRARGYAPLPLTMTDASAPANESEKAPSVIALGAHLKNTVAVTVGDNAFISQHIGDLESQPAHDAFREVVTSLQTLLDAQPSLAAVDLHPDYLSTKYAATIGIPIVRVQHHHAHVAACAVENHLDGPILGVAWDGTGYGRDRTIWGGEFLLTDDVSFSRAACLRPFRLPGGETAVKEPRRSALGVFHAVSGRSLIERPGWLATAFTSKERQLLLQMLELGFNAPITTSAGRLFDAVAAMLGLCDRSTFEGQAAMELEFCAAPMGDPYPFVIDEDTEKFAPPIPWEAPRLIVDWQPTVEAIAADASSSSVPIAAIAARFHETLAAMIVAVAERIGESRVALTGGCFQNTRLLERSVGRLRDAGFVPYWHQRVPPNDGGLSLGQAAIARDYAESEHEQGDMHVLGRAGSNH